MSSPEKSPGAPLSKALSLKDAQNVVAAACAEAAHRAVTVTVAVVDASGHLLAFGRMDGCHLGTIDVALAKARTAAYFRKATSEFARQLAVDGKVSFLAIPNLIPVDGGVPLQRDGAVAGAVGVSGASSDVDHAIAVASSGTRDSI